MTELTALIAQARGGDAEAAAALFAAVYADLKRIAARQVARGENGGLGDTSLVHEAYLRLARPDALAMRDREHFYAVSARVMRQIAIDHARERLAQKRGGGAWVTTLGAAAGVAAEDPRHDNLLALDAALSELEGIDARLARLVELRFFVGLSAEEVAELMDLSVTTLKRDWRKARAFLHQRLGDGQELPDVAE
jgi:RNA polymerase sigma factor (TIGR02999 family)